MPSLDLQRIHSLSIVEIDAVIKLYGRLRIKKWQNLIFAPHHFTC